MVEYARLDFANPGTFTFWIVSSLYYVVYNYSAWLNVIQKVSVVVSDIANQEFRNAILINH